MSSIYIISDIEGSSLCNSKADSQLFTPNRYLACKGLTMDINAVCSALFDAGVSRIRVKDFHRTGFNIIKRFLDKRIELDQGFCKGPIVGIGEASGFDYLMLIGLHAASGTEGFLPHTLTSQFSKLEINGKALTESELFCSSVSSTGMKPIFFSGCSVACAQAKEAINWLDTFNLDKPLKTSPRKTRIDLANAAVASFKKNRALDLAGRGKAKVFALEGPFKVKIEIRDGAEKAKALRSQWNLAGDGKEILFNANTHEELYWQLIRLAYFTPWIEKNIDLCLKLLRMLGKLELATTAVLS